MTTPISIDIEVTTAEVDVDTSPDVLLVAVPGPPGPPGVGAESLSTTATTAAVLSGHRVVTMSTGGLEYASAANIAHATGPLWLTTGAWGSGVEATVITRGIVTEPSWSWTPGPLWLGTNGALSQSIPAGAAFVRQVATVVDSTTIEFSPHPAIVIVTGA